DRLPQAMRERSDDDRGEKPAGNARNLRADAALLENMREHDIEDEAAKDAEPAAQGRDDARLRRRRGSVERVELLGQKGHTAPARVPPLSLGRNPRGRQIFSYCRSTVARRFCGSFTPSPVCTMSSVSPLPVTVIIPVAIPLPMRFDFAASARQSESFW